MKRVDPMTPRDPGSRGPKSREPREPRAFPLEALAAFVIALALRAGYSALALGPHPVPSSDALSYDTVAWNLARGVGFALDGAQGHYATAFVPPVVPWLTSLLYRVVGHSFPAAVLLQCVIGALVPLLLAAFARATVGSSVARIALWLAVLHPLLVFFSGYLLTETTFCAMLLLALLASVEWLKTPRRSRGLGAGLLWGAAALTRPTALPLPILVALWAWVPLGLTTGAGERAKQLAILALGVALVVAPWTIRNAGALHAFVPITTGGGRSLLDANNPIVWADPATRGGATSVYHLEPYATQFRDLSETQIDARSGAMAREYLMQHTSQWPAMALAKLARFWRLTSEGGGTGRWSASTSPLAALLRVLDPLLVWSLLTLPLSLYGIWVALRGPRGLFQSLPLLVILAFTAGAILYWGSLRLRVPGEPLVVLYAAIGLDALLKQYRVQRSGMKLVPGRG